MKNSIKLSLLLAFNVLFIATTFAQNNKVSLKIGGSYFINCKRTIVFGEQSIMNIVDDDQTGKKINFDIFSPSGTLDASLSNGSFTGINAKFYVINKIDQGFIINDIRNNRMVLKVMNIKNKEENRNDLHIWADFFLPNGKRFQCTPEESNVAIMQMMTGATFENNLTAIQLH